MADWIICTTACKHWLAAISYEGLKQVEPDMSWLAGYVLLWLPQEA